MEKRGVAFTAGNQSWEWNRLPFGLTTAPGTFVNLMRTVLDRVINTMTYLDDIIIFTDTLAEHLDTLETVFQRMTLHNLQVQFRTNSTTQTSKTIYIRH